MGVFREIKLETTSIKPKLSRKNNDESHGRQGTPQKRLHAATGTGFNATATKTTFSRLLSRPYIDRLRSDEFLLYNVMEIGHGPHDNLENWPYEMEAVLVFPRNEVGVTNTENKRTTYTVFVGIPHCIDTTTCDTSHVVMFFFFSHPINYLRTSSLSPSNS